MFADYPLTRRAWRVFWVHLDAGRIALAVEVDLNPNWGWSGRRGWNARE
jgi:hypothetical protein